MGAATLSYSYDGGLTWHTDAKGDGWPLDGLWEASTAFTLGQHVQPTTSNGYRYECTVAGTTDSSAPTWPTTIDDTVVDNGATWTCRAAGAQIVRYRLPATPHKKRRIMVKISSEDSARWGVRHIRIKYIPRDQDHNR